MHNRVTIPLAVFLATFSLPVCRAQSQTSEPVYKLQHLDVTQVDKSVNPCENFYQYTCGKLNAENPIPADQIFWGVGGELQAWNRQVLREILEKNEAPNSSRTPNEQKIGDFYASCMNQATSNTKDLPVIQPLLDQISAMKDKREIAGVLAAIHRSFGQAWQGNDNQTNVAMLGYGPQPDYNDVSRVVAGVDQAGLGMPSRDFYLKTDPHIKELRERYETYVATILKLAGANESDAAKDAATILRVETAMAQSQMDNITRRDPNKTNNRYTLVQLKELVPNFDWAAYLEGVGAPSVPLYEVSAP